MSKIFSLIDLFFLIPNFENLKSQWSLKMLLQNPQVFVSDLEKYPALYNHKDISYFSCNPNITFEYGIRHINYIDICKFTANDNISVEQILSCPKLGNVNYYGRSDIDIEYIKSNPKLPWSWINLSVHTNIKFIQDNPDLPWNTAYISYNKTLTLEYIKSYPEVEWDYLNLSAQINIKEIEKDLAFATTPLPWNFDSISDNKTLTSEFLIKYINQAWDWEELSRNESLDFDKLINTSLRWSWEILSTNSSLTKKFIEHHLDCFLYPYCFGNIYQNGIISFEEILSDSRWPKDPDSLWGHPELTADYILNHSNFSSWNIELLSQNRGLRVPDLQKLIDAGMDFNYKLLSRNPNLNYNFIYKHKDKNWDYFQLSYNEFNHKQQKQAIGKIKINYMRKKKREVRKVLEQYIISDLGKIINRYF